MQTKSSVHTKKLVQMAILVAVMLLFNYTPIGFLKIGAVEITFMCLPIAIGAIMAWGPGDAVAAIVGRKIGKHKLQGKHIEGIKSVEGSIGMAITAFVCLLPVLLFMSALPWYMSVIFALAIAPVASLTELFTKGGWDTVTVPAVVSLILCLSMLWG